ncbi:MAG: Adaptive-response sensory-kinase SasA [Desulfovibrio sp.]
MDTADTAASLPPLPPVAVSFLRQIADAPQQCGLPSFTYASKVILPATGWPEAEFLPLLQKELVKPSILKTLEQVQTRLKKGDYTPFSFILTDSSGAPVYFLALPRPGSDGNGDGVCISLAAQAAHLPVHTAAGIPGVPGTAPSKSPPLVDRESPILRLLDVLPAYVLIIDKDHSVRFANRVARQIFGSPEGKTCHLLLKNAASPCAACPPFGVFSSSTLRVHDWIHARSSSAFRAHSYPFEMADGARYVLQIGINITAGVRAQNALDLSEQRYRSIAENLTIGLVLADPSFNTITLNPKMEEWFGPGAVKGVRLDKFFAEYGEEAGQEASRLLMGVVKEKSNQEGEFSLTLPTGDERHFRLIACPILARSNILRAVVVMLEDVTDSRNMAMRMQQMQRLEALGSLAGGIAHEINQPLSALHLYAGGLLMMLESGAETPADRVMERLSLILSQADKIRQIVNHMRALVMQEENPPLKAVSVAEAVTDALSLVGAQLRDHKIAVTTYIPDDLPLVAANAMQLEQVVINLLVNAMHALDTVSATDKAIHITAEKNVKTEDASAVLLKVRDNGPGLGALQSRVFDPFFTTKDPDKGMGLGLSIVHAFISGWGGSISAANNADAPGAVFSVTVPAAAPFEE